MYRFLRLTTLFFLVISVQGNDKPLKVFILAGQSNMRGTAKLTTLPHMAMDPITKPLHDKISNNGKFYSNDNVKIVAFTEGRDRAPQQKSGNLTVGYGADLSTGDVCGPELAFGITMYEQLKEPILIIKTSWGGKSICQDFRPPSAGPFPKAGKEQAATGHYYRLMTSHVKKVLANPGRYHPAYKKSAGYKICGFAWFQGWNDMVNRSAYPNRNKAGGYDAYSEVLAHFIRDVRQEFNASEMPFAIGVMGVGGPTKDYRKSNMRYQKSHQYFRDAMAAPSRMDEFKGTVKAVLTENFWPTDVGDAADKKAMVSSQVKAEYNQEKKKNPNLSKKWIKERTVKLESELLTEAERSLLEIGKSNAGFHYLGSLKCYSGIGDALAKALFELQTK